MQRTPVGDRVRLFGIRHHGPGSARSLVAALEEWRPQLLIVEGPVEATDVVPHLLDESAATPIAMLFYAVDTPRWASYYPLAEFSPELQAFRWAGRNQCPIRFMDLPASATLGFSETGGSRSDALDQVAEASEFDTVEEWWEHLVERRSDPCDLFAGIESLMGALRGSDASDTPDAGENESEEADGRKPISHARYEALREAHMRRTVREALAEGFERIAVVCGAWHVPALRSLPPEKLDNALLKGLPKLKIRGTVVPWTFDRLTYESGYGAGATSPAYFDLVFRTPHADVPTAWLLSVARLMREEDLDASPASVIEAVRLADALAGLRGRPRPGLRELGESAASVLIRDQAIWSLINRRLVVGEQMGSVPENAPQTSLQSDLAALQKRLRLTVDGTDRRLELDLRGDIDLQRSQLLHRLNLLGVPWGSHERVGGKKGTFHEHWRIRWEPELTISLIEAGIHGNTVLAAASNCAIGKGQIATDLSEIANLVEWVLTADLPDAISPTIAKLEEIAATHADVAGLADALPPLAAVVRYGTVRRTNADQVMTVLDAIFTRLCVGLPGACVSLDDDSAHVMGKRLDSVNVVVGLFEDSEKRTQWLVALAAIAHLQGGHPFLEGKAERLRFDLGEVDGNHLSLRLRQAVSSGAETRETAAFVEGLLDGPGAILLHQEHLFRAVDEWIVQIDGSVFDEVLPLIRRSVSLFTKAERRQIGERVAGHLPGQIQTGEFDAERAKRVLPVVRQLLGIPHE
ncbi:MAG: DUF5682 family protein [Fimbriimonas sp.]|nr:DUF5682 family protein [Fimbriimonas sp.]